MLFLDLYSSQPK